MLSVLTNTAAAQAVRALNDATADVTLHQQRITTGRTVNGTKDDSASYIIAQSLRSDAGARRAISQNMARASSVLDVAASGAERISDLVNQIKSRAYGLTGITDTGARSAIYEDIKGLVSQIDTVAKSADFNGTNMLAGRLTPHFSTRTEIRMTGSQPLPMFAYMTALPKNTSQAIIGSTFGTNQSGIELDTSLPADVATPPPASLDPETAMQLQPATVQNAAATFSYSPGGQAGRIDVAFDAFGIGDTMEVLQNGTRIAATGQSYAAGGGAVGLATAVSGKQVVSFDYDPAKGPLTFRFNDGGAAPGTAWAVTGMALSPIGSPIVTPTITTTLNGPDMRYDTFDYDVTTSLTGDKSTVRSRDITAQGLGLDSLDGADVSTIVDRVTWAQSQIQSALSHFGSKARALDGAASFNSKLGDVLDGAVGNLVDADLAKEWAALQAAQIKQQLAAKALSIANDQPKIILSLFDKVA
ncbi:flagellin [uncultured Sphingomonas sp.]|uniref:flagellin n=1 Tax=uncultured Sphingomonas sp. TaxID=158754 RepID=UPI0025F0281E|nr:flagellin [uncultured Sphingomonas sp.]